MLVTPPPPDTVAELFARLSSSVALELEPARRLRWAWFDTSDRRLARADLALREERDGSDRTLELLASDGSVVARAEGAVRRPAAALPPGELADAVLAVTARRGLRMVTEATCERHVAR